MAVPEPRHPPGRCRHRRPSGNSPSWLPCAPGLPLCWDHGHRLRSACRGRECTPERAEPGPDHPHPRTSGLYPGDNQFYPAGPALAPDRPAMRSAHRSHPAGCLCALPRCHRLRAVLHRPSAVAGGTAHARRCHPAGHGHQLGRSGAGPGSRFGSASKAPDPAQAGPSESICDRAHRLPPSHCRPMSLRLPRLRCPHVTAAALAEAGN